MIPISSIYDYCYGLKGVTEHFPFDEDTLVFKVGGKMFALLSLKRWEEGVGTINLKCDPEKAEELRANYDEIIPGYHMSKKHWNTVNCQGSLDLKLISELILHSYELVYGSLTKKVRDSIDC